MSNVTSPQRDGKCQLVHDSIPLILNGHWRDPAHMAESTYRDIEAHRRVCGGCAATLDAAFAEGETAAAFDRLMRESTRRRLRPEAAQREGLARFAKSQPMTTATDQACDEWVGTRLREGVRLGNQHRHTLLAMIEAHKPSELEPDVESSPAAIAQPIKRGRMHRLARPNPRWFVPVAGAAAVLLLMMAGFDSQATMAEDAVTSTENLPLRWTIEELDAYDEELREAFSAIQADPKSAFFNLLPDAVDTEAQLYVRGITNQVRLGGRNAVTIEYRCDYKNLRCILHATRFDNDESLPEALGVSVRPLEVKADETAVDPCRFWSFTVNGTTALAWHDRSQQVGYVLVAPSLAKEKLKEVARCLRHPSRHVGHTTASGQ